MPCFRLVCKEFVSFLCLSPFGPKLATLPQLVTHHVISHIHQFKGNSIPIIPKANNSQYEKGKNSRILQRQQEPQYRMHHHVEKAALHFVGIRNSALTHVQTIFDCYVCLRSVEWEKKPRNETTTRKSPEKSKRWRKKKKKTKIIIYISHTIENWIRQHSFSSDTTPQTANIYSHTHTLTFIYKHTHCSFSLSLSLAFAHFQLSV